MHLRDGLQVRATVGQRYRARIESGALRRDPAQEPVVAALDRLVAALASKRLAQKSSALGWLFGKQRDAEPLKGLYIHGGVGRGKTMLMDMFFDVAPVRAKRRAHFNDFMADAHDRIHKHRQARKHGLVREDDPIPPVAKALAREACLLCFDEFAVTDIADAMILSRLFSALFAEGVMLVATSNVAPRDLYRDGLNRQLFLPFVDILEQHAQVIALASPTDYRLEKLSGHPVYLTPLGPDSDRAFEAAWDSATRGTTPAPATLTVKGRAVKVPLAAGNAARFTFADLCEQPLGARDYLAIAERFATVFLAGVPVIRAGRRNEAKRFILLIDTLYDRDVRLIVSAEAPPDRLYAGQSGTETFEFQRTASRLIEMESREWLDGLAGRRAAREAALLDQGV